jgi:hypothetical protein
VFGETIGVVNLSHFRSVWRRPAGVAVVAAFVVSGCADTTTTTAPTVVALASIVLSTTSVLGGTSVTGVLTLTGLAPTDGAVVTLASSTTTVTVPASVTIPAGSNSLSFPITTTSVAASSVITATYTGTSQTATLVTTVVTVSALQSIFLSSVVSMSGVPVQGTVTLTAPAPPGGLSVALASSSPSATVPASLLVPFGNTVQTFQVDIGAPATPTSATITASYSGVARSAALTIGQLAFSIGLASIAGGLPDTGVVSLPTRAPDGGASIALTSNSPNAIVPASVTIPAGSTSQSFTIATVDSPPTTTATISAAYGGVSQTATVTVVAYPNLVAVSCTPTTAVAGTTVQCTGTLASPSPAGGWQLALASSDASVSPPATVTVAPAALTFQFSLATGSVSSVTAVTVAIVDAKSGLSLWTVGLSVSPS